LPIAFDLDHEARMIRTRCVGDVTFDEVVAHFQELAGLAPLPRGIDVVLDPTAMESLPEGGQMQGVAFTVDQTQVTDAWGAWAVIADRDALYGMIRILRVFVEAIVPDFGVFRSEDEALSWLEGVRKPLD